VRGRGCQEPNIIAALQAARALPFEGRLLPESVHALNALDFIPHERRAEQRLLGAVKVPPLPSVGSVAETRRPTRNDEGRREIAAAGTQVVSELDEGGWRKAHCCFWSN
jgi:hypothetical protein